MREYKGYTRSLKCVEWKPMSQHEFATGARNNIETKQILKLNFLMGLIFFCDFLSDLRIYAAKVMEENVRIKTLINLEK